ncbi:MAG: MBL fold metallo-hydrolase [Arcobacteraceae bacterium]|jgi:rhodanese-related sulfurtransferase/glyoxylase-like metal-dependent hydrolase (beta-lactamase superfamily II)
MYKKIILSILTCGLLHGVDIVKNDVLTSEKLMENYKKDVKTINTLELSQLLKTNPNTKIIDVRIRADIAKQGGYIKANKVTNISRDKLEFMIADHVKADETFVVHCYTGNISLLAAKHLKDMGYKNVLWYKDSFKGWKEAGLETRNIDGYIESMLFRPIEKVADGVYASIGELGPGTYENSGHNNNLGFVIGDESVLVWNAGGSYLLAKALHEEIKKITNKPIKYVVLENSQGHASLGSGYWKEHGAIIVAQEIVQKELIADGKKIEESAKKRLQDKYLGTSIVMPDIIFKDNYTMDLGNRIVEAKYFGYAHEKDDIIIWLPKEKITFAGDLAFYQRMLPIFEITETKKWLLAWEKFEQLGAKIVIPGHGDVTDMNHVRHHTKDYLVHLRTEIGKILEAGEGQEKAYLIDQSEFEDLDAFNLLAKLNAGMVFKLMEFEE